MANSTKITLKVIRKVYKSGTPYYHLTGRIFGEPHQENFPTQDEAEAKKVELIRVATQGQSAAPKTRIASTIFPTDLELHAAEVAYSKLKAALPDISLTTVVDFYLSENAVEVIDTDAEEAVEKFCSQHVVTGGEQITSDVRRSVLRKFLREQGIKRTSEITEAKTRKFILDENLVVEASTRLYRRDLLHAFFEFLRGEKHMGKNLANTIKRPAASGDGIVSIFGVAQCQKLLDAAAVEPAGRERIRGAMLPYFACCMLSGMRPNEVRRLKPDWSNVIFENEVIVGFRAKTKKPRNVAMEEQLAAILLQCRAAGLAPGYFSRKAFEHIQRRAGVKIPVEPENAAAAATEESTWDNDILRHSFASHHYAVNQDKDYLVKNMGNSEDVLDESYLSLTVLKKDGAAYFQMMPADTSGLGAKVPRPQKKSPAKIENPITATYSSAGQPAV